MVTDVIQLSITVTLSQRPDALQVEAILNTYFHQHYYFGVRVYCSQARPSAVWRQK